MHNFKKVLLVEFINADMFPGQVSQHFPLLKGSLNFYGIESRWIRFAVSSANFYKYKRDEVTLNKEDFRHLIKIIDQFKPDLIILNHELFNEHLKEIKGILPVCEISVLKIVAESPVASLINVYLFDNKKFFPDYCWEPGNRDAVRHDRNNIYILLKRGCGYLKSIRSNPFYKGIRFGKNVRQQGCAFCGNIFDQQDKSPATPLHWITKQLKAVKETLGNERLPQTIMFENLENAALLEHTVEIMQKFNMEGVKILIGCRTDNLVRMETSLRKLLAEMKNTERAIHVFVIGLENFSDTELLRLNKGTTQVDGLKTANLLKDLEVQYPGNFHYSGYEAFSVILFTPWTTFADLHLNLRLFRHLGISGLAGNIFMSRLRLHSDLAVTYLAQKQGLVDDSIDDEALLLNRRKLFRVEKPWHFKEKRIEPVNRIATRLDEDPAFEDDLLYKLVQKQKNMRMKHGFDKSILVDLLSSIVDAAFIEKEVLSPEKLLRKGFALWVKTRSSEKIRLRKAYRIGETIFSPSGYIRTILPLLTDNLKPLVSVEEFNKKHISRKLLDHLEQHGIFHDFSGSETEQGTLFISKDKKILSRMHEIENIIENSNDSKEINSAKIEAGVLFGYPECCARAWSENRWSNALNFPWAVLDKRLECPEQINLTVNPLLVPDISFIPCSMKCRNAETVYSNWFSRIGGELNDQAFLRRKFLFSLGRENEIVSLSFTTETENFYYDPAQLKKGKGKILEKIRLGDHLRIFPSQIQVWNKENTVALWSAEVGLWDFDKTYHADSWKELCTAMFRKTNPEYQNLTEQALMHSKWISADEKISKSEKYTRKKTGNIDNQVSEDDFTCRSSVIQISFKDKKKILPDYVFFIGKFREGDRVFKRCGNIGLVHLPCSRDKIFEEFASIIYSLISAHSDCLNDSKWWEEHIEESLSKTFSLQRYYFSIEQR
jgi:hypothetical protein